VKFSALVIIVEEKREEEVVKVAKEAGAGSVTILHGRNMGLEEKKIFFGLTLEENVTLPVLRISQDAPTAPRAIPINANQGLRLG